jgi:hypothetical protein
MRETKCNAPAWAALIVLGLFASPAYGAAIIYTWAPSAGQPAKPSESITRDR